MQKYVVGFAMDDRRVALIKKMHPDWQKGLLNGIGGKIETGETPLMAMVREFEEETGVPIRGWKLYVTLHYPEVELYVFKAKVTQNALDSVMSATDEEVVVLDRAIVSWYDHVKNLKWLLPLVEYDRAEYLPFDVVVTDFESEGNS